MFSCWRRKNTKVSDFEIIDGPIESKNIKSNNIIFGQDFNYPIINLPGSTESIVIENRYFNQSIDNLPICLKLLVLNGRYNQPLDYLPYGLEILKFKSSSIFSHRLDYLPATLKLIEIPLLYNHDIDSLPDSIEEIRIGVKTMLNDETIYYPEYYDSESIVFNKKINKIPEKLKKLFIFGDYEHLKEIQQKYGNIVIPIYRDTHTYKN